MNTITKGSKYLILVTLLCIALLVSACGNNGDDDRPSPQDFLGESERRPQETAEDIQAPAGEERPPANINLQPAGQLSVLASAHFAPILERAEVLMSQERNITLDITTYNPETHSDYWANNLQTMLASGSGFDLFFADPLFPLWEWAHAGYLADFYSLIDNCPWYHQHDFYHSALQALAVNDNLFFFPLGFGFQYVGINSKMPQPVIDRFLQHETITVSQLIDIYHDVMLHGQAPPNVFGGTVRTFARCRDLAFPGFMAWNFINSFVDMETRTSNLLDDDFLRLLNQMLVAFPLAENITEEMDVRNNIRHNTREQHAMHVRWDGSPGSLNMLSFHYFFAVHNEFLNPISAIVPFTDDTHQYFTGFIPLVDELGRYRSNMSLTYPWKTVCIRQGANQQLAWEFVSRYLIPASLCHETSANPATIVRGRLLARTNLGGNTFDSPINMGLTEAHFTDVINATDEIVWFVFETIFEEGELTGISSIPQIGLPLDGIYSATPEEQARTISDAIAHIEALNYRHIAPLPLVPFDLFEPAILQMLRRMISPEDAASQIHNAVSQWFVDN